MNRVLSQLSILAFVSGVVLADGPETGVVTGTVTDASKSPMPGVSVTLTGDRGEKFTQTEANGDYRFALLVPGNDLILAELEGLGRAESDVVVVAGQRSSVDLQLVAETSETITVTSEAPMVDKYNVAAGQTMQSDVGER